MRSVLTEGVWWCLVVAGEMGDGRLTGGGINQTPLLSLHNLPGAGRPRPNTFTPRNNNQRERAEPGSQHSRDKVELHSRLL